MTVDSKLEAEREIDNESLIHYFDIESIGESAITVHVVDADGEKYLVPYQEVFKF